MLFRSVSADGAEIGRVPLDDIGVVIANAHGISYSNNLLIADASNELFVLRADQYAREFALNVAVHGSGHEYKRLDAIAATEGVKVDRKDLEERIRREAERISESYDELRLRLSKGGGLQALETQMVREKSLDLITSIANIQGAE